MSLYNQLFGVNEDAPILLGMISVNMQYFERFRDVFLANEGRIIRVYTRLGGNNREEYKETWEKIRKHDNYICDFDDGFDETYAYIEFSVPDKFQQTAKMMFKEEPILVSEKFKNEVKEMDKEGTPAFNRAKEIADLIMGIDKL